MKSPITQKGTILEVNKMTVVKNPISKYDSKTLYMYIPLIVQSSIVLISKKHHYIIKAGDSRATHTLVIPLLLKCSVYLNFMV